MLLQEKAARAQTRRQHRMLKAVFSGWALASVGIAEQQALHDSTCLRSAFTTWKDALHSAVLQSEQHMLQQVEKLEAEVAQAHSLLEGFRQEGATTHDQVKQLAGA